jgi:hypothetical protein
MGSGGSHADAALGTGGTGAGGTAVPDAPIGTGGLVGQTGGRVGTGGAVASGGKLGTGGALAVGGSSGTSTSNLCGTIVGLTCPAGQFCDLASNCGTIADAGGNCVVTEGVGCTADYNPVCGCNGQTYPNDCARQVARVLKAGNGACGGGTGGTAGAGGRAGTGGTPGTGGRAGTGGVAGGGGAAGAGGSTGTTCGGSAHLTCPSGQYCDLASNCGQIADATGMCAAAGTGACAAMDGPVCGCDGKIYPSDCDRRLAGMLKAPYETCASRDGGVPTYANAYLAWDAPGGNAGTGPAVVVGSGWADTWDNVTGFCLSSPETPPSSATGTYTLPTTQTDALFARLASVTISSLPHATTAGYECYPVLYFRLCAGCPATTLKYNVPQQLGPEMDPVWLWFDQLLTASAGTNPRNYCNWDL